MVYGQPNYLRNILDHEGAKGSANIAINLDKNKLRQKIHRLREITQPT